MNKRQIFQLALAGIALVLIILLLFKPGWDAGKILSLLSNALLILGMLSSYRAEEKMKKKEEGDKTE